MSGESGSLSRENDLVPLISAATHTGETPVDVLVPMLYDELRRVARRELMREQRGAPISSIKYVGEVSSTLGIAVSFGLSACATRAERDPDIG